MVNTEHLKQELYHEPDIIMIDAELNKPIDSRLDSGNKKKITRKTHLVFFNRSGKSYGDYRFVKVWRL